MLVEDTTAFVETLEVVSSSKKAEKRKRRAAKAELGLLKVLTDVRRLEHVVTCMERESDLSQREVDAARARLKRKREDAVAKRARYLALEQEAQSHDVRATTHRMYRLHSSQHYVDYSASQFERLSGTQRAMPVSVTTSNGRRWWWFLDRFWWDGAGLGAEELRGAVLDRGRELHESRKVLERAQDEVLGPLSGSPDGRPTPANLRGGQREVGRCVDCGFVGEVALDFIPVAVGGPTSASTTELRCESCLVRRLQNEARKAARSARPERV
jgi:hypothetical protein